MRADSLWWSQTPGPMKLVECLVDTLLGNGSAWLSGTFSWQSEFCSNVKEKLGEVDSNINVEVLDAAEWCTDKKAEELIFSYDERASADYLPAMDLAEFVQSKAILKDTIFWFSGVSKENDWKWMELSKNLAKLDAGLRIVCAGSNLSINAKKITLLKQSDYVTEFDTLLFAMTLVQSKNWNTETKIYFSRLANELSARDPEKIDALIEWCDDLLYDPIACVQSKLGEDNKAAALNAVRTAQIMSLYPKIEQARAQSVAEMYDRLVALLPFTDEYDALFEKPEDMELRHIIYFERQGRLQLTKEEKNRVSFLYNMRNELSHRQIISGEDANALLNTTFSSLAIT